MNRKDFLQTLISNNIDPLAIGFDDTVKDGYGIRKNYFRWEIYFRERGVEYNIRGFPSEEDALAALLDDIIFHK